MGHHFIGLVMNQDIFFLDTAGAGGHHFHLHAARFKADALVAVLAEQKGLAMFHGDLSFLDHGFLREVGKDAVVINDTVLQNLDERGALVFFGTDK